MCLYNHFVWVLLSRYLEMVELEDLHNILSIPWAHSSLAYMWKKALIGPTPFTFMKSKLATSGGTSYGTQVHEYKILKGLAYDLISITYEEAQPYGKVIWWINTQLIEVVVPLLRSRVEQYVYGAAFP